MINKLPYSKTVLDDNAEIYNRKGNNGEKSFKEMSNRERVRFFVDYYLIKVLIFIAGILLVIGLVWNFFFKEKANTVLYIAVVDDVLAEDAKNELQEKLEEIYCVEDNDEVVIDDSFYTEDEATDKIQIYLSNNQIDIIIADEKVFDTLAGYGYFTALEAEMTDTQLAEYGSLIHEANGYLETDEITVDDINTGRGELKGYGIDISKSVVYTGMDSILDRPIAGITANSSNAQNAVNFVFEILMENNY